MPKRSLLDLETIADHDNLARAFVRAARGKRHRPEVREYEHNLEARLGKLRRDILLETVAVGNCRTFVIRDPKVRIIHAPCFAERVLHHALMAHIGPILDKTLVVDTYACRENKGSLAAVYRAQHFCRRHPWYVKMDIRKYFDSIDHAFLKKELLCRFKNKAVQRLCFRIIDSYRTAPGKGLPIGALTSQHFANYYLNGLDRLLLETIGVCGYIRYMDDILWWCRDKHHARLSLANAKKYLTTSRNLEVKEPVQINRSSRGVTMCGFRVFPSCLLLSLRRRRRFVAVRHAWETAYALNVIDATTLQAGYSAALSITAHAQSRSWRTRELQRHPIHESCREI